MNKFYLFIFLTLIVLSCEVQFDRNVRIESAGSVIDENNAAMPNVFVGVYTESARFTGFYPSPGAGSNRFLLGSGFSNETGSFSVTSLFDSDQDFFIFVDGEESHTSYLYSTNTYKFEPENFLFNLGEIELKSKAQTNVNITRSSPPGTTLDFLIIYQSPLCEEVFVNGELDEDLTNCYREETILRNLDDDDPDYTGSFNSFVSGTIKFIYRINGGSQITENFVINQANYDVDFTY
jgi:hypothetical protein